MTKHKAKVIIAVVSLLLAFPAVAQEARQETRPSIGVDARGDARRSEAVDPTKNVLDLVEAAIRRQDDLRTASENLRRLEQKAAEELNKLRYTNAQDLAAAQALKLSDEAKLRSDYEEKLRNAEAKRIDAIRLVDVGAAATLAQRTTEQATALATVVTQSAEVLRNQVSRAAEDTRALVATTAATALQNQQQQFQAITTRLAALEQTGAEGRGKQTFQDPQLAEALRKVELLTQSRSAISGAGDFLGWIFGGIATLGVLVLLWRNRSVAR